VGYCRVSTQKQANKGHGLPVQAQAIRRWCKREGHRLVSVFSDEAVNGSVGAEERPGLSEALAMLAEGRADAVVVLHLDRLARSLSTQEGILAQVWRLGGRVFTVNVGEVLQDDPDDPMRTAMRQMMGVFGQLERGMISARLRAGRRLKAEGGGFAYGSPPYGKRSSDKALVDDPQEAAGLAAARELRAEGLSLRAIGARLEAQGYSPRRSAQWHPQVISRMLSRDSGPE
jgi:DNA invertase Pin-like site-specific DNA recombinase